MFRKLKPLPATAPAIIVDGIRVPFEPGETVAAVMLRLTPPLAGVTRTKRLPRAPYCLMGACFECNALVAGLGMVRTCMQPARDGMQVDRSAISVRIANERE